jgi:membrane-associated phospholipid phosphatase
MGKQERLAEWVSNIAAPPVLAVLSAVLLAQQSVAQSAWRWALAFGAAAVVLPAGYVAVEVWRGGITDLHVQQRDQRIRPYLVALACAALVSIFFFWWPAPREFRMLALANGVQLLVFLIITLRWKISLHSAAAGSLTVLGVSAMSTGAGLLFALSVPLISWARVRLDRHTPAQTITGAIVGALAVAFALWVM